MTLDGILLGLVLLFAVFGFFTGVARQIASLIASVAAYFFSKPLGEAFGPQMSKALGGTPELVGILATTLLAFITLLISVRWILTSVLRRMVRGKEREHAGIDRMLGFVFGGLKVAVIGYVMLSALAFVEDNVTIAGKRLGISPKDSQAFLAARQYNLFANTQFAPVKDLARVAEAMNDPVKAEQLRQDPAFQKLMQDPRFKAALQNPAMAEAARNGDYGALLKSDSVLQLVQNHLSASRLSEASDLVEHIPPSSETIGPKKPAPNRGNR